MANKSFNINCHLPAKMLMSHPQFIKSAVEVYFRNRRVAHVFNAPEPGEQQFEDLPPQKINSLLQMPSPEEYALHLGFSNFLSLRKAIENQDFPEESRHYLMVGCALISDMYTRAGLTGRLNNSFTKFIMSAYLGINEKIEQSIVEDKTITITWNSPNQSPNDSTRQLVDPYDPDIIELERLEAALPKTMQLPPPEPLPEDLEDILR